MYTCEIFSEYKIFFQWSTVYWGVNNDILDPREVSKYVIEFINDNPDIDIPEIFELAWENNDKGEILRLMESVSAHNISKLDLVSEMDEKKWRYCILRDLVKNEKNQKVILKKVEEIYSDFGYPNEMIPFISYMPPTDGYNPSNHTSEDNTKRMIRFLDDYLTEEEKVLKGNLET